MCDDSPSVHLPTPWVWWSRPKNNGLVISCQGDQVQVLTHSHVALQASTPFTSG